MASVDLDKVKQVFASALDVEPADRDAFLDEACGGNAPLRNEIESWLASYAEADDFIETSAFSKEALFENGTAGHGRQFGNYRIFREIGRGGMGAVFLAERSDGEFEHLVALKIVRQSIAEVSVIERFRQERQILASLNHPNIAKLLDGGVTESGEPYLVMEYIEGLSLLDFANQASLSTENRLKLFLKICRAVSYAHQNLIVHRDLKPSNALVTADGEPKLLDFGLAKVLDATSTGNDQTKTAFRALTPAYASPEQMRGETVTTASDIYSLGVILYELLTGERPFNTDSKSLDEIIKTVTEFDPPAPSTQLRLTGTNAELRGDLDNIALMALRKEPERRYQTVEAFAGDIERYLDGLPISARPNTLKYRTVKFLRRNKAGTFAASLVLLTLISGIIASLWQARIAEREKEKAVRINAFLENTLKYSNPILNNLQTKETTVNEVLDEAARRLDAGEFDSYPEVKAELERTVAVIYFGQGRNLLARKHLETYIRLLREVYPEDHPKMIIGSIFWARVMFARGEIAEAESAYRKYLPLLSNEYKKGEATAETLADEYNNFAYLRRTQGDSHEAESLFRQALDLLPLLSEQGRNSVASTRSTLASTIADQGRFAEALQTAHDAVDEFQARGETASPNYGFCLTVYGGFLTEKGDNADAAASLQLAETILRKFLSTSNLWLGDNLRNQAILLYNQGKYAEAIEKADETINIYDDNFGKHYDHYPTGLIVKGLSLTKTGRAAEGEKLLREAVHIRTGSLPRGHFWVAAAEGALGEYLTLQNRFGEAEELLQNSFESLKASQEPGSPRLEIARTRLIALYNASGRQALTEQYR